VGEKNFYKPFQVHRDLNYCVKISDSPFPFVKHDIAVKVLELKALPSVLSFSDNSTCQARASCTDFMNNLLADWVVTKSLTEIRNLKAENRIMMLRKLKCVQCNVSEITVHCW